MYAHRTSQSRHKLQLNSLKWGSQGDAMAATQTANSVLQPSQAKYDECVCGLVQRRQYEDPVKDADMQYKANEHAPCLIKINLKTLSDETHRK